MINLRIHVLLILTCIGNMLFNSLTLTMEDDENQIERTEIFSSQKNNKRKRDDSDDQAIELKRARNAPTCFDDFPDEIIMIIFELVVKDQDDVKELLKTLLLNIKLVSSRWSRIVDDKTFMKYISDNYLETIFKPYKITISPRKLQKPSFQTSMQEKYVTMQKREKKH